MLIGSSQECCGGEITIGSPKRILQLPINYTQMVPHIRTFLKKDLAFIMMSESKSKFNEMKKVISGPLGLQPFVPRWDIHLCVDFSGVGMGLVLTKPIHKTKRMI